MSGNHLPPGPATAVGPDPLTFVWVGDEADDLSPWSAEPTPIAGAALTPPPPTWTVTTAADPLPPGPPAAEVAAVRALPIEARRALCACAGPGWTVHAEGPAVPRLQPPPPERIGGGCESWLPADSTEILNLAGRIAGDCWRLTQRSGALVRAECGEDVGRGQTPREAAIVLLLAVWP